MELTEKQIRDNPALKKFENERKCEFCEGFFLSKEEDKYCPNCVELVKKRKKDVVYQEATNEQLNKRVESLETGIGEIKELLKALTPPKAKTKYKPKKCACGTEFIPEYPAQKTCGKEDCGSIKVETN